MVAWHEVPGKSVAMNPSRRVRCEKVAAYRHLFNKARASSLLSGDKLTPYPNGTDPWVRRSQALRAWLPSFHPSGIERPSLGQFFHNALGFI
jgi:hypothetical protein